MSCWKNYYCVTSSLILVVAEYCDEKMGMTSQEISDDDITASSSKSGREAYKGRPGVGSWAPLNEDESPYFQVILPSPTTLTSISTQGGEDGGYVRGFQLQYSLGDGNLMYVREEETKVIKVERKLMGIAMLCWLN